MKKLLTSIRNLGSSLVAGSSDNDPTTVATLAVVGSTVGFGLNWLLLLILPLLTTVLMLASRTGMVTREGLQTLITHRFGRIVGWSSAISVIVVSELTLAADIAAGADALGLIFHTRFEFFVIPFGIAAGLMLNFGSYERIKKVLLGVMLIFIAYIGSGILSNPSWGDVLHSTFVPHFELNSNYITGALALLGTTMTSYVYFWQSIEEKEEKKPIRFLRMEEVNAAVGMTWATVIFFFIIVATAATLGASHTKVETAQQAAQALQPIAGPASGYLFALGLLASASLAAPVLASTCAYVTAETFGWNEGLDEDVQKRSMRPFYFVIWVSLAIGSVIPLLGIPPIDLLFYASVFGGLGTPFLLVLLILIARDPELMGDYRANPVLSLLGWISVVVISSASLLFLANTIFGLWG